MYSRFPHSDRSHLPARDREDLDASVALGTVLISCQVNGRPEKLESLVACLANLPNVKLLDLQRSRGLRAADLALILNALVQPSSVNVSFAEPLEWQSYGELQQQYPSVSFQDVLEQRPCASLSPKDVIFLQCYALHAGRIDVCFTHASVSNRANTGPLSRFMTFFEPSAPYAIMCHSDAFTVGELFGQSHNVANSLVEFQKGGVRRLFEWQVSLQSDGCWATDNVGPASWHDVMLAELDE